TAKPPLDVGAMAWSWQAGRKFSKIEVTDPAAAPGTWTAKTFTVHLGSTGCTGNPATGETVQCKTPNRMAITLPAFDPAQQKIAVDLKALLAGNDITRNQAGAAGCMSGGTDPECAGVFQALAIDWKDDGTGTGLPIAGGAAQTVFRPVAR
ncbi:MAG: metallo-mystery pair system four-Cys motif protein, partial [Giesbergeria sp.]|nr:metallo-mystery pair system four-Cys motif protein [Giesbergeria sp.]